MEGRKEGGKGEGGRREGTGKRKEGRREKGGEESKEKVKRVGGRVGEKGSEEKGREKNGEEEGEEEMRGGRRGEESGRGSKEGGEEEKERREGERKRRKGGRMEGERERREGRREREETGEEGGNLQKAQWCPEALQLRSRRAPPASSPLPQLATSQAWGYSLGSRPPFYLSHMTNGDSSPTARPCRSSPLSMGSIPSPPKTDKARGGGGHLMLLPRAPASPAGCPGWQSPGCWRAPHSPPSICLGCILPLEGSPSHLLPIWVPHRPPDSFTAPPLPRPGPTLSWTAVCHKSVLAPDGGFLGAVTAQHRTQLSTCLLND